MNTREDYAPLSTNQRMIPMMISCANIVHFHAEREERQLHALAKDNVP